MSNPRNRKNAEQTEVLRALAGWSIVTLVVLVLYAWSWRFVI